MSFRISRVRCPSTVSFRTPSVSAARTPAWSSSVARCEPRPRSDPEPRTSDTGCRARSSRRLHPAGESRFSRPERREPRPARSAIPPRGAVCHSDRTRGSGRGARLGSYEGRVRGTLHAPVPVRLRSRAPRGVRRMPPSSEIAVVLGGTGDIGGAVAGRLAQPHRELILSYLQDRERAEKAAADLRGRAAAVHLVEGNIGDDSVQDRILSLVAERGNACHQLVHCVAVTAFKPLLEVKPNQWDLIFQV